MKQKRVLTIQDYSCLGRCSLTVALPTLSVCGVEAVVCPFAVQIDVAGVSLLAVEREVHVHVVARVLVLYVVAVSDIEGSVGVFVVEIVRSGHVEANEEPHACHHGVPQG